MKRLIFALVLIAAFLLCLSAIAGESVVIDSVQYQAVPIGKTVDIVKPGEVVRHAEKCVDVSSWFTRTTTCMWAKTVTGTTGGVVVTDGSSRVATSMRGDRIFGVASIWLMALAMVLKHLTATIINKVSLHTTVIALITFMINLAFIMTIHEPYVIIVAFATCLGSAAAAVTLVAAFIIDDWRRPVSDIDVKVFYATGCVNIAFISLALSLLW